jgi:glycosyltransferase involved in cell wall biosynthesis/predicted ATP-grasp superfamily ATP-dependent carboligase
MMRPRSVLVLDGHTNQALACVRSLGRAGHRVLVASTRRRPLGAWSRFCRESYRLGAETVPEFAALREWARERAVTMVMPLTERSCLLCNLARDQWESAGMAVGCAPSSTLLRAFDKALTLDNARACGVRTPDTWRPTSLADATTAAETAGFPCVVKARFSSAWNGEAFVADRGACYVADPGKLSAAVLERRQGDHWPLIQRFVPGRGKGAFALCDHGEAVAWFAHERLRDVRPSGSGSSLRRSVALDSRLREPAEQLLRQMRWHGPAMVEFRDDDNTEPCLIEVNGRFWGSLQLAIDAGVDFPVLWLALLDGEAVAPVHAYRVGVTLRWLLGDVKRFLNILAGPPPGYPGAFPTRAQGVRELFGGQPVGTRLEMWDATDPWPAVGEWVQGVNELMTRARHTAPVVVSGDAARQGPDARTVSIIIPCRNEERHMARCLESILASDYPPDRLEVLVVDGMSTDRTREIIARYVALHPRIRLFDNPEQSAPAALNIGLRAATGDIIMRMDAHVFYPPSYITRLVSGLEETGADNVGGVIHTLPADDTPMSRAIALGMSHPFGVGNSYFRIGSTACRWVDTVPFGCYRREVFERIGLFDEELIRNQDDELNFRLIKHGGRILLMPSVVAEYYARSSLRHVARMFYQYGYFKPLVAQKVGRIMTVRQLIPALLVVSLVGAGGLAVWWPTMRILFAGILGSYATGVVLCAARAAWQRGVRCGTLLAAVFPVMHFSYGFGFLERITEQVVGRGRRPHTALTIPLSR